MDRVINEIGNNVMIKQVDEIRIINPKDVDINNSVVTLDKVDTYGNVIDKIVLGKTLFIWGRTDCDQQFKITISGNYDIQVKYF